MTRSRATAKAAGTSHETRMARWFAQRLRNEDIDRLPRKGANDIGDIGPVRDSYGRKVAVEAKDYGGRLEGYTGWLREAEAEAANYGAVAGVVIAKRRGTTDPAQQTVIMTAETFAILIEGTQP